MRLYRADLILAGLCLVSAGLFLHQSLAPLSEFELPDMPAPVPRAVAEVQTFLAPPQASFAAIDARPIFNPARTPIESTATVGGNETLAPPTAVLVGVILDPKNQLALLKNEGAPFASGVGVGGSVEGWQVVEIGPDYVQLRAGAREYTLRMIGKRFSQPSATGLPSGGSPAFVMRPQNQTMGSAPSNGPAGAERVTNPPVGSRLPQNQTSTPNNPDGSLVRGQDGEGP